MGDASDDTVDHVSTKAHQVRRVQRHSQIGPIPIQLGMSPGR